MKIKNILKQLAATTSALVLILITLIPAQTAHAAFPGLNGKISWNSTRDGNSEVYKIDTNSLNLVRLTNSSTSDISPNWSPDGTRLTFSSDRSGNYEVYSIKADGTDIQLLSANPALDYLSTYSPDGAKIAFNTTRDGNDEVYTMNADGTNQVRLTNQSATDAYPKWSPDGTKIAFHSLRDGNSELYTMNADGTNQTRITNNSAIDERAEWSPGGTKIAFSSNRTGHREIFVMNADGTNLVQLTTTASGANENHPTWSPDGTQIGFVSERNGNREIYTMNTDGTNQTRITNQVGIDERPSWQPLTIHPAIINPNLTLDATKGVVVYNAPANHTDAYEEIDLTTVTITTQPQKGRVAVNSSTGEITYSPDQQASTKSIFASLDNFFFKPATAQSANQDNFTYQICSTANSRLCTSATVTVNLASAATLASTGLNLLNLIAITSISLSVAFTTWVIRKKFFLSF